MKKIIKKFVSEELIEHCLNIVAFISIQIFRIKHGSLIIRKNTTDISVYKSIFILNEFKIKNTEFSPKFIIDAGAYTGLSSLYFSLNYPKSEIVALEPETSNFEVLSKNSSNKKNIKIIKAGLWYKNAFLKIINGKNEWGHKVIEVSEIEKYDVEGISIDSILKNSKYSYIDIIKIDIEGAEKEIFDKGNNQWIEKTNIIIIELHDRFKPGCKDSLYNALNIIEWNIYQKGEKIILIRKYLLDN